MKIGEILRCPFRHLTIVDCHCPLGSRIRMSFGRLLERGLTAATIYCANGHSRKIVMF